MAHRDYKYVQYSSLNKINTVKILMYVYKRICNVTYTPIVIAVGHLERQSLEFVRVQSQGVLDYIVTCWAYGTLIHKL